MHLRSDLKSSLDQHLHYFLEKDDPTLHTHAANL